jgi:hypothetical protein
MPGELGDPGIGLPGFAGEPGFVPPPDELPPGPVEPCAIAALAVSTVADKSEITILFFMSSLR